ncbi:MAG: hypothetical protein NVV66_18530 [Cellulomonas sp.]|uniref:hypothetical protein n=1 Tax=Cellulomonas sp. TaxID=40001 RepID=UPI00258B57BA|nr:hypothetical protein [Cellulomonas sp.]MCR6706594.1 hypothetical protein [Cellulomonas sp.]
MTTTLRKQISEDLDYLLSSWPLLVELGVPGTAQPRRPHRAPSPEQLARAALQGLQERVDARQPGAVRGTGPIVAPIAINLLDLLARFVADSAEFHELVTQAAGVERLPSPRSAWTDPTPYLLRARPWLSVALDAGLDERAVAGVLRGLADAVAAHLGEVHDGQTLDALCPWCRGRSESAPVGGERTLVVYARLSRLEQAGRTSPSPDRRTTRPEGPMIVCRGESCTPPDSDVGWWVGTHPAWPEREWTWLADRLLPAPETVRV